MVITGVTLTGADDKTNPEELIDLSAKFPFVEWGILVGSNGGKSRFPSGDWIYLLNECVSALHSKPRFALHVCGRLLRGMLQDASCESSFGAALTDSLHIFKRWQLNFHGEPITPAQGNNLRLALAGGREQREIIVQLDGVNNWVLDLLLSDGLRASGLYDTSHGAGVLPGEWPVPNAKWEIGYAGGLGPDNVVDELGLIAKSAKDQRFWIDMETKLRTTTGDGDKFDLWKCKRVLELCRSHFKSMASA